MNDPINVLLSSPRSLKAIDRLGYSRQDLQYLSKEEFKVKLGNMKITKSDLDAKWQEYEKERKDKIQLILEVGYIIILTIELQERKKIVGENRQSENGMSYGNTSMSRSFKQSRSVATLPNL